MYLFIKEIMDIEKEIEKIKKRNAKVEADKAWETSFFRRGILTIATYVVIAIFLISINAPNPWFSAAIPAIAFLLSTLTLPFIKEWWIEKRK